MIKAVLFDLDGTLLDTNELILKSFDHAFKTVLNMELKKDEITSLFGKPLKESLGVYTTDKLDEIITCYRAYNEEIHDSMCYAFEGVKELLKDLKDQGIKLGIVTSKRKILAEKGCKISDILKYFDVFITPESTNLHKPNGEPAIKACMELGVDVKEAIMVGDSHYDLLCGKNAGTKTCGVTYTALDIKNLKDQNPDYFIDSPLELLDVIKEINENIA